MGRLSALRQLLHGRLKGRDLIPSAAGPADGLEPSDLRLAAGRHNMTLMKNVMKGQSYSYWRWSAVWETASGSASLQRRPRAWGLHMSGADSADLCNWDAGSLGKKKKKKKNCNKKKTAFVSKCGVILTQTRSSSRQGKQADDPSRHSSSSRFQRRDLLPSLWLGSTCTRLVQGNLPPRRVRMIEVAAGIQGPAGFRAKPPKWWEFPAYLR